MKLIEIKQAAKSEHQPAKPEHQKMFRAILTKLVPYIDAPLVQDPSIKSIYGKKRDKNTNWDPKLAYVAMKGSETLARIVFYPTENAPPAWSRQPDSPGPSFVDIAMRLHPNLDAAMETQVMDNLEDLLKEISGVTVLSLGSPTGRSLGMTTKKTERFVTFQLRLD